MRIQLSILAVLLGVWLVSGARADTAPSQGAALVLKIAAQRRLPPMSAEARLALATPKTKLVAGDAAGANAELAKWLAAHKPSLTEALQISAWLIREGVLEQNPELANAGDRARFFAEQQTQLKAYLSDLRALVNGGKPNVKVKLLKLAQYSKGADASALATKETQITQAELGALITKLDDKLNDITEMKKLAGIELQASAEKSSQVIQTLSNISKSFHDTAKSIISNIKS